jgi:hypothetical protein
LAGLAMTGGGLGFLGSRGLTELNMIDPVRARLVDWTAPRGPVALEVRPRFEPRNPQNIATGLAENAANDARGPAWTRSSEAPRNIPLTDAGDAYMDAWLAQKTKGSYYRDRPWERLAEMGFEFSNEARTALLRRAKRYGGDGDGEVGDPVLEFTKQFGEPVWAFDPLTGNHLPAMGQAPHPRFLQAREQYETSRPKVPGKYGYRSYPEDYFFSNPKEASWLGWLWGNGGSGNAERLARARELGFDTDTTLYHGTNKRLDSFYPHSYFTTDPEEAAGFARVRTSMAGEGEPTVHSVYMRGKIANQDDFRSVYAALRPSIKPFPREADVFKELEQRGFTGYRDGRIARVFDPSAVRSTDAAFDPAHAGSSNIMFANPKEATPAGMLTMSLRDQAPAGAPTSYKLVSDGAGGVKQIPVYQSEPFMPKAPAPPPPVDPAIEEMKALGYTSPLTFKWFKERMAQYAEGLPDVPEHGPLSERIYRGASRQEQWPPTNPEHNAFWGSDDPLVTERYSHRRMDGDAPSTTPATVNFQRPLVLDAKGGGWDEIPWPGGKQITTTRLTDLARLKGYDGIVVRNVKDGGPPATTYAAIKPGTVKSATTGETLFANAKEGAPAGLLATSGLERLKAEEAVKPRPNIPDAPLSLPELESFIRQNRQGHSRSRADAAFAEDPHRYNAYADGMHDVFNPESLWFNEDGGPTLHSGGSAGGLLGTVGGPAPGLMREPEEAPGPGLMAKASPVPASRNEMQWDRAEREAQRNLYLNQKYFQPPIVPPDATPEQNWAIHRWIRDMYENGATPEEIRDMLYRQTPAR